MGQQTTPAYQDLQWTYCLNRVLAACFPKDNEGKFKIGVRYYVVLSWYSNLKDPVSLCLAMNICLMITFSLLAATSDILHFWQPPISSEYSVGCTMRKTVMSTYRVCVKAICLCNSLWEALIWKWTKSSTAKTYLNYLVNASRHQLVLQAQIFTFHLLSWLLYRDFLQIHSY